MWNNCTFATWNNKIINDGRFSNDNSALHGNSCRYCWGCSFVWYVQKPSCTYGMIDEAQRKKMGDILCDIWKYMVTVVPFGYFFSDKPYTLPIIIGTAFFGFLFILFGLYFTKRTDDKSISTSSNKKKIKILKNTTFVVEESKWFLIIKKGRIQKRTRPFFYAPKNAELTQIIHRVNSIGKSS